MAQAISSLGLLLPRINAVPMRRRHYGHGKAQALRWQHFSPGSDQFLVSAAHSADVAVKIIQPQWIDVDVLLTKRGVPVDLIGERGPGKTYCRDAGKIGRANVRTPIPNANLVCRCLLDT